MTGSVMEKANMESDRFSILFVVMTNLLPNEWECSVFQRLISVRYNPVNYGFRYGIIFAK